MRITKQTRIDVKTHRPNSEIADIIATKTSAEWVDA